MCFGYLHRKTVDFSHLSRTGFYQSGVSKALPFHKAMIFRNIIVTWVFESWKLEDVQMFRWIVRNGGRFDIHGGEDTRGKLSYAWDLESRGICMIERRRFIVDFAWNQTRFCLFFGGERLVFMQKLRYLLHFGTNPGLIPAYFRRNFLVDFVKLILCCLLLH